MCERVCLCLVWMCLHVRVFMCVRARARECPCLSSCKRSYAHERVSFACARVYVHARVHGCMVKVKLCDEGEGEDEGTGG